MTGLEGVSIRPAGAADAPGLLSLMRRVPVRSPGESYALEREPDPFALQRFQGSEPHLLLAIEDRRVLGMICVNIDTLWLDGEAREAAYSCELKLLPEARGRGLGEALQRASLDLCQRRQNGPIPLFNTVMRGNPVGLRMNRYLPGVAPIGELRTCFWPTALAAGLPGRRPGRVRRAGAADLPTMANLWAELSPRRQLARVYPLANWSQDPRFPAAADWLLLESGQELIGFVGVWDQRPLRQVQLLEPPAPMRLLGWRPGLPLALGHCVHLCLRPEARSLLPELLQGALRLARTRRLALLTLALDAADPLNAFLPRVPASHGRMDLCANLRPRRLLPFHPEMSLG